MEIVQNYFILYRILWNCQQCAERYEDINTNFHIKSAHEHNVNNEDILGVFLFITLRNFLQNSF